MVRSGRYESPEHTPVWDTHDVAELQYYKRLMTTPNTIFCGFNHMNVRGIINTRYKCEALKWDERRVGIMISTWH